jgi:hypothetical protein
MKNCGVSGEAIVRKMNEMTIATALCLVSVGLMSMSASPLLAQSNDKDILLQDIKAYRARCDSAPLSEPAHSPSCANEKAELLVRQKKLNLTDADVDTQSNLLVRRGGNR